MEYLITVLIVVATFEVIYWQIVRPFLLDVIRFRLDDLIVRLYLDVRQKDSKGAYQILHRLAAFASKNIDEIDCYMVVAAGRRVPDEVKLKVKRDYQVLEKEKERFGEFNQRLGQTIVLAMFVNSPAFGLYLAWLIFKDYFTGRGKVSKIQGRFMRSVYCRV